MALEEKIMPIADPAVALPFGSWNDLPNVGGSAGSDYEAKGYVVEFGGMPGDTPVDIIGEVTIKKTEFSTSNETRCGSGVVTLNGTSNTGDLYWYDAPSGGIYCRQVCPINLIICIT